MKKLLMLLLMFPWLISYGQVQDYSIINFVPYQSTLYNGKSIIYSIYVGKQNAGTIAYNENLQFKIYSEGRITLIAGRPILIDVKKGNTYWVQMNPWNGKYGLTDEKTGEKLFKKNINTIYAVEDKNNPIVAPTAEAIAKSPSFGTGFLLTESGLVVTNHHVIDKANKIVLKGINGDYTTTYTAKVLLDDSKNDLAIIQLENKTIKFDSIPYTIRFKGADTGEEIYVLGYPMIKAMGEEVKLTTGVISAKTGYQGDITSYQVSAPVQGGNSGGPLFDKQGNLTGVINSKIQGAEGVTYAIKTNYLNALIDLLPTTPILNGTNKLSGLTTQEQVKKLSKFIFIIEVNN